MRLTLLGTGSPIPDPTRAGPSTLVQAAGASLLFDCGRGVLMRTAGVGVSPPMIDALLLTHLHSDHTTDLNDLITMRWAMSPAPNPLPIYGPPGTTRLVERTLSMLEADIGWRIAHHDDLDWEPRCDVTEVSEGTVLERDGLTVTAERTEHKPVDPTVGYRVESEGRVIAIAGDTVPCNGLDRLVAGADAYVQTVIRDSLVRAIPVPRLQDILDYHSSIEQAAATAERGGVAMLVMTHPVPPPLPGTEHEWEDEARTTFSGEVTLAHDLQVIDLSAG